jgi:hypothetical protein
LTVAGSFVLVRTSTIDVVRIFEANGLYSPTVVGGDAEDDAATSNDVGGVGGIW